MTTTISYSAGGALSARLDYDGQRVSIEFRDDKGRLFSAAGTSLDTDSFLAAVAAELDVVVIPRADLPTVTVDNGRVVAGGKEFSDPYSSHVDGNPNWSGNYALSVLAVHEYIKAHPPVDEAQVALISNVLAAEDEERGLPYAEPHTYRVAATSLFRAGVRVVKEA